MTETLAPRHAEILAHMVEHDTHVEAGNGSDTPAIAPFSTLQAMARRGLVELSWKRQDVIHGSARPYRIAKITDAGRQAVAPAPVVHPVGTRVRVASDYSTTAVHNGKGATIVSVDEGSYGLAIDGWPEHIRQHVSHDGVVVEDLLARLADSVKPVVQPEMAPNALAEVRARLHKIAVEEADDCGDPECDGECKVEDIDATCDEGHPVFYDFRTNSTGCRAEHGSAPSTFLDQDYTDR
jgi:hypothetical protein